MEDILTTLADYQREAMSKGIDFKIDVYRKKNQPNIDVNAVYTSTGSVNIGNTFTTTFSAGLNKKYVQDRMQSLAYFLQTATGNIKNEK